LGPVQGPVETRAIFSSLLQYLQVSGQAQPAARSEGSLLDAWTRPGGDEPIRTAYSSTLLADAPISSGERLEAHVLHEGDWKLIWDRTRDVYLLHDLESDPTEQRDLAQVEEQRLEAMRARLKERIQYLEGRSSLSVRELDAAEVERLKALGYL
jgi:hypothetical protein